MFVGRFHRLNRQTLRNRHFMVGDGRPWWRILWINIRLAWRLSG